jgi:hypothetical protein
MVAIFTNVSTNKASQTLTIKALEDWETVQKVA